MALGNTVIGLKKAFYCRMLQTQVYFNGKEDTISRIRNNMKSDIGTVNPLIGYPPRGSAGASATTGSGKAEEAPPTRSSAAAADAREQLSQGMRLKPKQEMKQPAPSKGRATGKKRSSAEDPADSLQRKRSRPSMVDVGHQKRPKFDRVRRRIILKKEGKPLLQASSLVVMVKGLLGGLKGELMKEVGIGQGEAMH
jgi:hypothetical protein